MMFTPKLVTCLREGYDLKTFRQDCFAGITVGIVAIPLALAFAISSGVSPDRGLFTAVIAGFLISALGGSRVQIGGPTGAFVVILYGVVQQHGYDGLALATMMAGGILMLMALLGFGSAIKFIPYPVITGFTSGIALIIFSSQVKDFLGLPIPQLSADFLQKWRQYAEHIGEMSLHTALLACASLAMMILLRWWVPKIPAAIVVVVAASSIAYYFKLPVETIGARFGELPSTLPAPHIPGFTVKMAVALLPDALTIALLGAIEALLSAVVADGMTGFQHRSNTELWAQGIANIAAVLFGGIAATGAIARTATNVKSGARTPVAGIVHALTILLAMWFLAPYAGRIPLCALAAILFFVCWHMSEIRHFIHLARAPRADFAVLLLTFAITVLVDLTMGVAVGMTVAMLLFMKHMSNMTHLEHLSGTRHPEEKTEADYPSPPPGVEIYELSGPFFFGAADRLKSVLKRVHTKPKAIILRMRRVPFIDASGLHSLEQFAEECARDRIALFFTEPTPSIERSIHRIGLAGKIGEGHILQDIPAAIAASGAIT